MNSIRVALLSTAIKSLKSTRREYLKRLKQTDRAIALLSEDKPKRRRKAKAKAATKPAKKATAKTPKAAKPTDKEREEKRQKAADLRARKEANDEGEDAA